MDDNTCVLIRVGSSLGSDCISATTWTTCKDVAVLENSGCVSKDEVNGSINVTVTVKLAVGVNVECVLVTFKAALIENG